MIYASPYPLLAPPPPMLALPARIPARLPLDTVVVSDALAFLRGLPDASIDMIFIDPPYNTTNLHFEQSIDWQVFWQEARRILKHKNSPVLSFSQQPFTTDLINSNRSGFRYELILEKTMPTGFLDANRRPLRCHENLLLFADAMPRYWPEFDKPEVQRANTANRRQIGVSAAHYGKNASPYAWYDEGKRYPRSVWKFAQRDSSFEKTATLHPTQKPLQAVEKTLRLYSQPGWVVVDCFCGSGTTLLASRNLDRRYIGCDISAEYVAIARERLRLPFEPHHVIKETKLDDLPLFAQGASHD